MNELARWQKQNDEFLAAAVNWVRLRLKRLAGPEPPEMIVQTQFLPPAPAAPEMEDEALPLRSRLFKRQRTGQRAQSSISGGIRSEMPLLPPAPIDMVTDEQVAEAAAAMEASAAAMEPPPALSILVERFGLSRFERDVLLLCATMELDTRTPRLCALAQDDAQKPFPTFGLSMALFDDPVWEATAAQGPLRNFRLLEITQPGAQPLNASALRIDERIMSYLKGCTSTVHMDDRISRFLLPLDVEGEQAQLPLSQAERATEIVAGLQRSAPGQLLPLIHLLGPDAPSKQLVAWHAAASLGLSLYRLPAALLSQQAFEVETFALYWQREALLLPVALYVDAHNAEHAPQGEGQTSSQSSSLLNRFLARSGGLIFLDTRDTIAGLSRTAITLDIAKPTPLEQQQAWANALGIWAADNPSRLAGQFNLSLMNINRIARGILLTEEDEPEAAHMRERLWAASLASTRPQLDQLAQRLEPLATWDDIVLPDMQKKLLRQIADQVGNRGKVYEEWGFGRKMSRGRSRNALFSGESGTGKTMAAEVLANELKLNLYRIDLSAVVSKYIGETEKNLRRLFDAAEDGGALLFFDEADALFGKRSEVKDAHDRYANIEINYLLQRMEAYRGLAILATNMKSALDAAFMRRLSFIVDFPFPSHQERRSIWRGIFPQEMDTSALDFDWLAKLNLTGGNIHNVALNAAFLAAREDGRVTMDMILDASQTELRKVGSPIQAGDFYYDERVGEVA